MVLNVKAFLEKNGDVKGEIRRFQVNDVDRSMSNQYTQLTKKVAELFGLPENAFRLFWQDSDGDFVTFSSMNELQEAIKNSSDGILRLFVKPVGEQEKSSPGPHASAAGSAKTPSEEKGQGEKAFHPGVVCDGCEGRIYGPRYKCVICPDYDLCSTCEQKGIHSEHDKLKITHPMTGGGPSAFMPPHFRRWMHRFMKKCQAGQGCPAGSNPCHASSQADRPGPCGASARASAGAGAQQQQSKPMGEEDEYLKNVGENIAAFLDPFGIDVSYEIRHGDKKTKGNVRTEGQGQGAGRWDGSGGFWRWDMFGSNPGGCTRMPQGPNPSTSQEKETPAAEKPAAEKPAAEKPAMEKPAAEETSVPQKSTEAENEVDVTMEDETAVMTPKAPASKEGSPASSHDDDWTMLNEADTVTDGPSSSNGATARDGLYPNLRVAQAVESMKSMGFNDDGGWLSRLLETTDGDIAQALDTLKLGADQASRLG